MKRLLLHLCCAPDGAYAIQQLQPDYEVVCFFYNPNIDAPEEYRKREADARQVAHHFGVDYMDPVYPVDQWRLSIQGLEKEPEGGKRCLCCYYLRLKASAEAARQNRCDWFTTVLTISPHKNSANLFEIGRQVEKEMAVPFLPIDFKKKDGFKKSVELSKKLHLYRQNYCGCSFSKRS